MRKGRKYTAVVLCALGILTGMWFASPVRELQRRPSVTVMHCETADVILSVYFQGTIIDPGRQDLYLAQSARVTDVAVTVGQRVAAGDVLLRAEVPENGAHSSDLDAIAVFRDRYASSVRDAQTVTCAAEDGVITVRSPIDGIVMALPTAGAMCSAQTLCAAVSAPECLQIRAEVPEIYVQDIAEGMVCSITGEAFRDHDYTGVVTVIEPYATTTASLTGTGDTVVEVMIDIDRPDDALRAGYNARVEIHTEKHEDMITVPYEVVEQDEAGEFVYVYADGAVQRRGITTGAELEHEVEVLTGLDVGECIVLTGGEALADGMPVWAVVA